MDKVVKQNYAWTKDDEKMMLEYVQDCDDKGIYFASGSVCTFVPFSKNVGAKLYRYSDLRSDALVNQMVAYNHGLAPKCGTPFEIYFNDREWYGYLTDIAEEMTSRDWEDCEHEVASQYAEKGFTFTDWHITNVGTVNGKRVVIDFDGRYFKCGDNTIQIS